MPKKKSELLIHRSNCKEYTINLCKDLRPQYTNVGDDFLDMIEEQIVLLIKKKVLFTDQKGFKLHRDDKGTAQE